MWSEQQSFVARIRLAENEAEAFEATAEVARQLGFDLCAYNMSAPLPISRPREFGISNYPKAWVEQYDTAGYLHIDPSIVHCRKSDQPIVWNEALFADTPALRAQARAHGLIIGWAQGIRTYGGTCGILTLARTYIELTPVELDAKEHLMSFLAAVTHQAMSRTVTPQMGWQKPPSLTEREIEALRWAADGKTTADTAGILGLSENTVKFHIKNATAKLDVANKTAAVAKAAVLGWLY